jgi:hypothetical protein
VIVFDLHCGSGCSGFEAWFRSTADYEHQRRSGLVQCPYCQSADVTKAPMAPRVPKKGSDHPLARLAAAQAEILKDSAWVGDKFADTARAIHAGEAEARPVHGNATLKQAKELADEGVPVAPLPFPVAPPNQVN